MKNKKGTIDYHQEVIAIRSLKMHPSILCVMGGPNKDDAIKYLASIGYTNLQLKKLQP